LIPESTYKPYESTARPYGPAWQHKYLLFVGQGSEDQHNNFKFDFILQLLIYPVCSKMSDTFEASEEVKAIYFEWTPELVKIRNSRGSMHPSLGPIEDIDGLTRYFYQPDMILPDPADTQECLKWAGLSVRKLLKWSRGSESSIQITRDLNMDMMKNIPGEALIALPSLLLIKCWIYILKNWILI
jgi:hypothetical protein